MVQHKRQVDPRIQQIKISTAIIIFFCVCTVWIIPDSFGTEIILNPISTAAITDNAGGFEELDGANDITTVTIGTKTYALVASFFDDGVQIIDITDPATPTATAAITDNAGGFEELDGASSITTVTIGTKTYVLVASVTDAGVQIIDITDPATPTATAAITDNAGGFEELDGASSITTVIIGTKTYALVASVTDAGVQIIDITDPATPTATAAITDNAGGFEELDGAFGITTVTIGTKTYALVASVTDDGVQIIDITDPATPTATAAITDGENGFEELDGASNITTVTIGTKTYALVASVTDDGVQIIDITDPATPTATAAITDGENGFEELDGANDITTVTIGTKTYALVASVTDDGVQIIDITDPATPTATAAITDGENGFEELDGAYGITTVTIGTKTYALVASFFDAGVQIMELGFSALITITLTGANPQTIESGADYTELGATTDDGSEVSVDSSAYRNVVGTYIITYTATDGTNQATATRTVNVVDTTAPVAPVITSPTTLTNENTITITGTTVEGSTVTLTQNDIALTPTIITSSDGTWSVDVTLIQGANTFTATATDQADNISDVSNSVTVTLDNTAPVAPVITLQTTLTNENTITITGTTVEGSTVTLTQNDNVLTSTVTIDSDGTWSVDVTLIQGANTFTATATDQAGNISDVSNSVTVTLDNAAPIITLTGANPQTIELGVDYTELGATTDDGSDVSIDSSAYRNVVGTYIITYTATDGTNQATATRTVNVVDTTAPIITLTGANPQTIELGVDYTELGATTDDGSDVSIDSSAYRNVVGTYIITYTATDGTNQATATRTVNVVDTTAPIITLTGANPQTIELGVDYTELGATTDDGSDVSVDSSAYRNVVGIYIITYTATDGTNQATATRTVNVVDTTAPVAPVITLQTTLTNENTITITGTTVEGSTVTLTQNDIALTPTIITSSDGTWSVDVTLIQGANTFTATATDQAGNISDVSNSVTVTLDNAAPIITLTGANPQTIELGVDYTELGATTDDGSDVSIDSSAYRNVVGIYIITYTATDGTNQATATRTVNVVDTTAPVAPVITLQTTLTNENTITITGTTVEGSTVTLTQNNIALTPTIITSSDGTWSVDVTLIQGANTFTATATDQAGNISDVSNSVTVTLDNTAPDAPVITLQTTLTNENTITITGTTVEGSTVTLTQNDIALTPTIITSSDGTWSVDVTLIQGANTFTATATDQAGNISDVSNSVTVTLDNAAPIITLTGANPQTIELGVDYTELGATTDDGSEVSIDSSAYRNVVGTYIITYTATDGTNQATATRTVNVVDTTAPVAPVITLQTTLTNENTITITGTTVEGSTVTLTQNDIALTPTIITSSDGTWSVDVTLIQGANTFTATATDQAGNISDVSNSVTVTLDNAAPDAPVITLQTTLTNENTITITGTTVEGSTVTLTQNDNVLTSTVTIDSDGTWSVDVTLIQGANTFTATATDQAGNISDVSNSVTVTLDNTAPDAPVITLQTTLTNENTITITGTTVEGSTVTLTQNNIALTPTIITSSDGTWSVDVTLIQGANTFTATATDQAGNISDVSNSVTVTLDNTAPDAPVITLQTTLTNENTITITGTTVEGSTVTLTQNDNVLTSTVTIDSDGTWSVDVTLIQGANTFTATATDQAGNISDVSNSVTVTLDNTAPIITLTGANPQTIELGVDYTELGATTDDGSDVSIDSSAYRNVVGTYIITYTATDGTNQATATRTVNVVDTTAPIITLTGANPQTIELGVDYTELGATTDDGSDVSIDSSAYRNVVGTYIITYTATDGTNQATATRTVNVVDTTAPIITLTGANPQTIELGVDYTELGATTDDGSDVSIDSSAYRNVVGIYIITYTATDGTNQATATRTVNVVDTTAPDAPVITLQTTLTNENTITITGTTVEGSTVTLTQNDIALTPTIITSSDGTWSVDVTLIQGANTFTATATDQAGNISDVSNSVTVTLDNAAPIITLTGANPQTIELGVDYTELGATTDDGSDVSIDSSAYRNVVGTYIITYTATDGTNQATATRTVNVVDTTAPIITLTGANPQTIELGVDYTELGATTDDGSDVSIDSSAYRNVVGTYIITYTATDGTNQATATRTVNVVDTTAPIITLTGANPQTIELGVDYTELGATTDDGSDVSVDSSAYRNVVGIYIITYTATDGTNQATATRTVNVVDTTAPVAPVITLQTTLTNENTITITGTTVEGSTVTLTQNDNVLTSTVTIDSDGTWSVDVTLIQGANTFTATATDQAGNISDVSNSVTVTLDNAAPIITLTGANPQTIELGVDYTELGATTDDGSDVSIDSSAYRNVVGTYIITYTATDGTNQATATRTVNVVDTTAPIITLTGANPQTIELGVDYTELGATTDDGSDVSIDSSAYRNVVGTYIITYTATDGTNQATATRTVNVVDTTAPVAPVITLQTTLTNENTITITGTTVEGSTVTLTQNNIALTPTIITSSDGTWSVDVTLIQGANTFTATATDQAGNISDVSNSVTVTLDNTAPDAPVITLQTTLTNENTITITGTTVEGSTVTLTQNDIALTPTIITSSDGTWSVDVTLIQGANTFTATATDQAGNISDVSNSVTVTLDNAAPIITLTGANPQTIESGVDYTELGATTDDGSDVSIDSSAYRNVVGTYIITYTATDGTNQATATRTVNVVDTTAPVAPVITLQTTLTNENTITITGTTVEGSTVTLTQNDIALTPTIITSSDGTWSVDVTLIQGANTFTATATDQAGNISDVSNSVTVTLDNTAPDAPVITLQTTLTNENTITITGTTVEGSTVTLTQNDNVLTSTVTIDSDGTWSVDVTLIQGANTFTATATDQAGNISDVSNSVTVTLDNAAPIITLTGANPQTIELGVDYTELGATTDDGSEVSIDSSAYRNVVGTYIITYTATDGTNQATATRTVNVVDTTAPVAPVITLQTTLTNENTITITGTTVEGSTVTLTQNDIALTPTIITSSDGTWSVDVTLIQGANTFTATATDQAGNISDVSNSVTVTLDNAAPDAPVITLQTTLTNENTITITGTTVEGSTVTLTQNDNVLTSTVTIDSDGTWSVDVTLIQGANTFTATATDQAGNISDVSNSVTVTLDNAAPIITLTGANPQTIELGVDYTELGATTDDGSEVSIDSSAYRNVVGTYIITYTATDGTNQATATRTVNVVDTTAPIITLTGANPQTIELGVDYTELGATTDDGSDVSIDSSAYRNVVGTYIITYTATDGTNQATATRTVNVVDTTAPIITLTGANPQTIELGVDYTELGATTDDGSDVSVDSSAYRNVVGIYIITYTATDGTNQATATRTVNVVDTTAPVAPVITLQTTLTNENTITITGTTVEGSTVTLTQNDNVLTSTVTIDSDGTWSVDVTLIQGANTFTATATDQAGNISDVSNSVTVTLDNAAPIITLTGANPQTIELGVDYTELGATTDDGSDVSIDSSAYRNVVGTYIITYTATDGTNQATATRTVNVVDTTAPIITLTGANPQTIELGVDYTELGATTDDGSDVSIDSSAYRNVVGTYIITYTATDGTNQATATRTVNVVDTTAPVAPVITLQTTLTNENTITITGTTVEGSTVTLTQNNIALTPTIITSSDGTWSVDVTLIQGANTFTATATDQAGNISDVSNSVTVTLDNTAPDAPVITLQTTLTNENTITITGTTVEGSTVTLTQNDIALTPTIITSSDGTWSVDVTLIQGANTFTATATDQAGNISDVSNSVTVTLDNAAPIITLTGANPQTIESGVDYTELGATTDDGSDVSIDSSAYRNVVGTYIITYTATDGTNQATATRTVNVVDTTAPVAPVITLQTTLTNENTITITGTTVEGSTVTLTQNDIALTPTIITSSDGTWSVDVTLIQGANTFTATATDQAGNISDVSNSVTVTLDNTAPDAPVITLQTTLTNENTITITGTTVEGSTVTLTQNDNVLTSTVTIDSDGTWSVDVTLIQGANTFTATATDQAGNISDVSNSVTVTLDNAAPIITLTGANPQTIELGVDYTELGATTDDGSDVSIDSSAYRNVVGTYIITYTATDGTNQATATRTVNVVDTTAPIITLTGANPQTIELGVDYTELGATTDDGSDVSIDSSAYRNVVGTYIITYTATDGTNQATATRTVNVVDTTAPIITLTGANPQTIELGVDYTELGATTDDGSDVSVDSSAYRNVVGIYIITYTATDGTNQATATRTVNVVDTTAPVAPVITLQTTLTNENTITITGTTVEGSTVTLTQNDIALTPTIITSSDGTWSVDVTLIQGANTFTATATDQAGNISDVSNSVTVTLDNAAPIITLTGANPQTIELGVDYTELGATTDDGSDVSIDSSAYRNVVGIYIITYTATDGTNQATATRTVNVVDTTAPVAPVITLQTTLTNENTITITGTTVEGSTVTLTQNNIALTPTIITSSDGTWSVDVTLIQGANTFTATATDQAGNISDVSNSVTVTLDNTAPDAPVITLQTTLTNENTITITGTTVEGSTVTLTQNDIALTPTIITSSDGTWSVDVTLIQGANTFTATATDQAGNISDVSNSVTVTLDNAAPIITLTGANPQTIELGVDYTELGATTDDGSEVSIDSSAYRNVVGTYIITYTATDGTNQATATRTVNVVDTTAPVAPVITLQTTLTNENTITITGTTVEGSTVTLTQNDIALTPTIITSSDGTWSVDVTLIQGANTFTATATDQAGNISDVSNSVTVTLDNAAPDAPVITLQTTLTNENTITITGTTVEGSTVTLTQNDNVLTSTVTIDSDGTWSVDVTLIQGANTFTATATDQAGNISDVSNSVTVTLDNAAPDAPVITLQTTLTNENTITITGTTVEGSTVTLTQNNIALTPTIITSSDGTWSVDVTLIQGANTFTATATDQAGNISDVSNSVTVTLDNTAPDAPVITLQTTLTNENTITITGTTVEGSTVTLTQNDNVLTSTVTIDSDGTWSVDVTLIQGANTFTATATDQAGNISDVSNSVTVTLDNTAPIITLTGANPQTIELGVDYTELGATTDDGSDVSIDSSAYRNVVGTYIITYTATDGTNQATATRTVNVVDTTAPIITLTGANPQTIELGVDYTELGATTDDGSDVSIDSSAYRNVVGTYIITYTATDGTNQATATRTVNVVDTTAPIITLTGANPQTIELGVDYTELGATTDDGSDVSIDSSAYRNVVGIYIITYTATDGTNQATATRTVNVVDTTAPDAPVITLQTTLTNENTITITGTTVEGSTVTLTQNDIALTPTIITSSDGTWSVDVTLIQGANTFTATATDQAGNISDVSNSVTVTLDNAAPIITLTGANPQTIELGVDYTELGATTDDGSEVSIDSSAYRNVVGTYIITYTATDGTNQATATRTVNVVDTTAPVAPVITLQTTLTNENTITITGTTVEGSTVTLTQNDIALTPTIITSSDGTWSVDVTLIQGANTFTATATDQAGNISDVSNSVTVTLDNAAPIITLTGANPQTIELGVDYTELGATTDDGSDVSIDSSAYRNVVGTYIITYTATDGTNQATATRTVNVVDTTAPIITLTGANPQTIELGVDYTELGATTDDGSDVSIDSSAYRNVVGIYIITYTATDGTNQATATRTVNVVDTTAPVAPVITLQTTLTNENTITITGTTVEGSTVTLTQNNIALTPTIITSSDGTWSVDVTLIQGANTFTATATDQAGNISDVSNSVTVTLDNTAPDAPVITLQTTLTNENTITITGTTVEGSTVTLTQNDIALTPTIITSSDGTWSVDVTLIQGANTFTATATDQAGNISDVSNSVTVTLDNAAPIITLTGANPQTIELGVDYTELGATTDDGSEVSIDSSAYRNVVGTYIITYTATDGTNQATATRTVNVVDTTAPVAPVITLQTTLTNENTITITGTTVEGSTVTLTQNDIALTPTIITSSDGTWSVDVTLIQGANTFTATATDQAGNISDVSNSVTVTLDNAAPDAPVITLQTTLTNENTITITGTTVEGSTVTLTQNDNVLTSTVTIDSDGTWSVDVTLIQGANTFTATATDQAGNISDVSNSVTVTLDNAAPIITLTGANPQTIELGVDYTELGATTDDGSDVSIDSSAYRNVVGTYIITYTATDGTNQATATRTVNVVDTTAPIITLTGANPQTIELGVDYTELGATTDDGSDVSIDSSAYRNVVGTYIITYTATDGTNQATATRTVNVVDTTAPIITLTGANPQTIELGVDYTELGATTDDGSDVSIDSSAYRNVVGIYIITYTATDGTNQATATRTVNVVDTTAPDAPVITLQTTLTNENTITITGTTVEGSTVTLTQNDIALTPTIITSSDGTWSVDVTLIQGANTFTATATDQAGNISDVSNSVTVTLDNAAPIITLTGANPQTIELGVDYTELGATTDDGSDVSIDSSAYRNVVGTYIITYTATDGTNQATATRTVNVVDTTAPVAPVITLQTTLTNENTITITGTTVEGSTVTLTQNNIALTPTIITSSDGTWSVDVTLIQGANTFTATATDQAGNISDVSNSVTVTLDNTAPDAPVITLQTTLTNENTITITGTTVEGSTVTLTQNDIALTPTIITSSDGTWSVDVTLIQGANTFTATATDQAGNISDVSNSVTVTLDNAAPIITLTGANPQTIELGVDYTELGATTDDGSEVSIDSSAYRNVVGTYIITYTATDGTNQATATRTVNVVDTTAPVAPVITLQTTLTNENTITITGTTVEGSTVTLTQNDIALTPTIITSSDGTWSVDVTLIQGANTFTATATDQAGNISDVSNSVTVTLDNAAPDAPVITLQTTLTNENTITITGTTVEGSTVTLTQNDNVLTSTVTIDSDGTWSVDVTLIQGANTFTATATDQAGNISDVSNSVTVTLDNAAPDAPVITLQTTLTNENTITITGTTVEGSTVTLTQNNIALTPTIITSSDGTWSVDVTLIQGANTFTATATDQAGNISDVSNSVTVTLDNTAPDAPVITLQTTLTNENTITITGTTVEGSTVTLTQNDNVLTSTVTIDSDGTWSVDVTLIQGANTFTATATDQAGNISDVSNSVTVTLDNTAPIITLTGANPQTIELGVDYTELGATTDDGSDVSIDSSAYRNVVGTYIITYTATDGTNQATATRTVNVVDTTAPIITLTGANPQTIELGVDYTELGATTDDGSDVSIDSSAYRNVVGTYIITYTATDGTNQATATRTVNVVDTTAPIITLTGANPQTIELGVDYTELGATTDDGSDVSIDSSAYRNVVGIYIITYTATDGTNQATATRTVNVVDTTAPDAPVITLQTTLTNENTITITGTTVEGSTVTLTQNDIALTPTIITSSDGTWSVDVTLIQGANTFTATATDQAGNISDVSNSVTVTLDNAAPIITLTGANPQTIELGVDYTELGATTDDGSDVSIDSSAYRNVVGTYIITYTATDGAAGNSAASVTRTVNVVDSTAPAISITTLPDTVNTDTMTIAGTAESDSAISLYRTEGFFTVLTTTANSNGDWSISNVSLVEGDNTFTATAVDAAENTASDSVIMTLVPIPSDLKKSGSNNDWALKPTFGKSHHSHAQIVQDGFSFNNNTITITDNWHTDFPLTSSIIGEDNVVQIKSYAVNPLKWIVLSLGVPRIGDSIHAEADIHLTLNRNYTNPADYDITNITHKQTEGLIIENSTSASIMPVQCSTTDSAKPCYLTSIFFSVTAPLKHNTLSIMAMDDDRRSHTTYINNGVEFTGESLLPANTHSFIDKKSSQSDADAILLTQQDRRYNIWEDQYGYLWSNNDVGSWFQITTPEFTRHNDAPNTVLTRTHSSFAQLIEQESDRATLIFDSAALSGVLPDTFSYDFDDVDYSASKTDVLSEELYIEYEKALAIMNLLYPTINDYTLDEIP